MSGTASRASTHDRALAQRADGGWSQAFSTSARWWIVPLLRLTTTRFRPDPKLDPRIIQRLHDLEVSGWLVRSARPRMSLSWRGAAALLETRPILVIPRRGLPFTAEEWNASVLRDLVVTELRLRVRGRWAGRDEVFRQVAARLRALHPGGPVDVRHVEGVLARSEAKLDAALGPPSR